MPRRSTLTLSGRAVDALAVSERDVIVWDRELTGIWKERFEFRLVIFCKALK